MKIDKEHLANIIFDECGLFQHQDFTIGENDDTKIYWLNIIPLNDFSRHLILEKDGGKYKCKITLNIGSVIKIKDD